MFRALRLIARNVAEGPVTVRLPGAVPSPAGYRGAVVLEPARCLACRTCAYVCVSAAITGTEQPDAYAWDYEPGRCTFCGRCLDHCPGNALSMSSEPPPAYARCGALAVHRLVPFPACPECGARVRPVTAELLARAFEHATDETSALLRLCERCRRKRLQRSLVASAFDAGDAPPRGAGREDAR